MRNKVINFDIDDAFSLDNTPTMERIRHKRKLIMDTNDIFVQLSKVQTIYPKGYYKRLQKEIKKDVFKGLKVINVKNPVFIEMPTLKKVGNGQIKAVKKDVKKDDLSEDDNIMVNLPVTASTNVELM